MSNLGADCVYDENACGFQSPDTMTEFCCLCECCTRCKRVAQMGPKLIQFISGIDAGGTEGLKNEAQRLLEEFSK